MTKPAADTADMRVTQAVEEALEATVPDFDAPQSELTVRGITTFLRSMSTGRETMWNLADLADAVEAANAR